MGSYELGSRLWRLTCPSAYEEWAQTEYSGHAVWPSINTPPEEFKYDEWAEIEWMKRGKGVADFTWPHGFFGWLHIIVRKSIGIELTEKFQGACLLELGQRNSQLLDGEVDLRILWFHHRANIDLGLSTWRMEKSMSGRELRMFDGIETLGFDFGDPNDENREIIHTPRDPNRGIFVDEKNIEGYDFFRTWEWPGAYLCTDLAKDFIVNRGLSNITLLDVGNVIRILS